MQILIIIFVAIPIIISLTVLFSIGLCREFNYLQNKSVVLNKKKQLDYVKEKQKQKIKTFDEILNEHINVTKKSK